MSTTDLTPFSYCVLALVGAGGAGQHDLTRMMRSQGGLYWSAAESQWYAEPKRLERLGYLRSRKEPGRTRERTHYRLTAKGRRALRAWLGEPSSLPRVQNEAIVRLLAADLGDDEAVLASLEALRAEVADRRRLLDAAEARAPDFPHRERYLRLVHRYGRLSLDALEAWMDEVERELG